MYRSPFHLTGPATTAKEIQLARRKLLAELELNGNGLIQVAGKDLNRQDISNLFDELADDGRRTMHETIWNNKPLLSFLEEGQLSNEPLDLDVIAIISRNYFSPVAGDAIRNLVQQILRGDAPAAHYNAVQASTAILLPAEEDAAYQPAFRYFTLRSNELEDMLEREKQGLPIEASESISWMSGERISLLNVLPDAFDDLRYQIARLLNNFAVALETNEKYRMAFAVIQKAAAIETLESLMLLIRDNLVIYRRKASEYAQTMAAQPSYTSTKNQPLSTLMKVRKSFFGRHVIAVWMLFMLGILMMAIVARPDKNNAPNSSTPVVRTTYPMDSIQHHNDTAFMALKTALLERPRMNTQHFKEDDFIPLILPCDTCGDGFAAVWKAMFIHADAPLKDTAGASQMVLTNHMAGMDMFVLTDVDNRSFSSIYLKPGQSRIFVYKGTQEVSFNFYTGTHWNAKAWHEASIVKPPGVNNISYFLQGCFLEVPPKQSGHMNPDYGLFSRTDIQGKAFRDTLEVKLDNDQEVIFMLGGL